MKDVRGTILKIGKRVCIQEDIPSVNGMLYKNSIVWWVQYSQVSASFL